MNPGETSVKQQTRPRETRTRMRPVTAGVSALPPAPDVASALSTAALVALRAPSVHQTQPWHWRVRTNRLELYADHRWQPPTADPDGRLLGLSCGAALHYVRTALRAMGYLPSVRRLPESTDSDLLAVVTVAKPIPVTQEAVELVRATSSRLPSQGPLADGASIPAIAALRRAAASEGVWLHMLRSEQARSFIAAVERSAERTYGVNAYLDEAVGWMSRTRGATTDFPRFGEPSDEERPTGSYGLLYGSGDRPVHWLRAGEAMSAVWLTAVQHHLVAEPISSVIEAPAGRTALQHLLSGIGKPYLALRFGVPAATAVANPRRTTVDTYPDVPVERATA